jgi:hypothetical protein
MTKKQMKERELRIERVFGRYCNGIAINIMDIGKVFKEGERLIDQGLDDDEMGTLLCVFVTKLAVAT